MEAMDTPEQPATEAVVDPNNTMPELILQELQSLQRLPFMRELSQVLGTPVSREARQKFYDRFPDRRAQEAAIFARLAGYREEVHITNNILIAVHQMSDMHLKAEVEKYQRRLDELEAKQGTRRKALPEVAGEGQPDGAEGV